MKVIGIAIMIRRDGPKAPGEFLVEAVVKPA
jgi:hypothetical protein